MDINPIIQALVQSLAREITPLVLAEVQKTIGEQSPNAVSSVLAHIRIDEVIDRVSEQIAADLDTEEVAEHVARKMYLTAADIAEAMDGGEVAEHVAENISLRDLAEYFNVADIAGEIGADDVAAHIDLDDLAAALIKRLVDSRLSVSIVAEGAQS